MKKTITIILLLTINVFYAQLQRLDNLMTSSETLKTVFNYDNNGNCLSTISQFRNSTNDDWTEGTNGLELSYNNNQIISIIKREESYRNKIVFTYTNNVKTNADRFAYDWNDNQWLQTGTVLYTYNSDGLIIEEVGAQDDVIASDGETLSFNGSNKYEYTYNSSNQNISKKHFEKNSTTNNQYVLRNEEIYAYNSDGLLSSIIYTNEYNDEQDKTELTYDNNNNLVEKIYSELNITTSNWNYSSKDIYTYDNSIDVNDLLLPNSYILNEYFENYNFNNKPTVLSSYQWNNNTNNWDEDGVINFNYTDTALSTNNIDIHNYTVYPNPTTNQVKFDITDFDKIEIYDITGKLIIKTKTNIVNMENVPNGTYLYRIQKGNKTINGKIIKK